MPVIAGAKDQNTRTVSAKLLEISDWKLACFMFLFSFRLLKKKKKKKKTTPAGDIITVYINIVDQTDILFLDKVFYFYILPLDQVGTVAWNALPVLPPVCPGFPAR